MALPAPEEGAPVLDRHELHDQIAQCRPNEPGKGKRLEVLTKWLVPYVSGLTVVGSNVFDDAHSQEFDVVVWNAGLGSVWANYRGPVPFECKNWSRPVGSAEVAWFYWKLRQGNAKLGILLAAHGITGSPADRNNAWSIAYSANEEERAIIVITLDELEMVRSGDHLTELVKLKLCALTMRRDILNFIT